MNASFVRSVADTLRDRGVRLELGSEAAAMLARPHAELWWASAHFVEVLEGLERFGGIDEVHKVTRLASHRGMGPLVRPLTGVLLAFAKSKPISLFSRVGTFVSVGVRGVTAKFDFTPRGGVLQFQFPSSVPAVTSSLWTGLIDVGFSLCGGGQVVMTELMPTTHTFALEFTEG